jgi:hypothetical protein
MRVIGFSLFLLETLNLNCLSPMIWSPDRVNSGNCYSTVVSGTKLAGDDQLLPSEGLGFLRFTSKQREVFAIKSVRVTR